MNYNFERGWKAGFSGSESDGGFFCFGVCIHACMDGGMEWSAQPLLRLWRCVVFGSKVHEMNRYCVVM